MVKFKIQRKERITALFSLFIFLKHAEQSKNFVDLLQKTAYSGTAIFRFIDVFARFQL